MQNAPAMLAQKMMNRQAPYGPIGMVSQNMSGNKKGGAGGGGGGGPVIGLKFDTATATAGVTFSNSDTTATNTSGGNIASAKANYATTANVGNNWYWEFTLNSTISTLIGVGPISFVCNSSNRVGLTSGVSYNPANGNITGTGGTVLSTVATSALNDILGFKLEVLSSTSFITLFQNGSAISTRIDITAYLPNNTTSWVPIWSSNLPNASVTISNNVYSYAGYTPIGTATTISASASVPAVADGAYDVYTFNASGTFTVASTGAVRALVIAGGGAGGQTYGGGGAGGYQEKGVVTTPQTYTVTVGAGGAGQAFTGTANSLVSNDGTSSTFSTVTTTGGGGGGAYSGAPGTNARAGGSGGGGSTGITTVGGAGVAGQGFAGGDASISAPNYGGGGGGGASAVGAAGTTTKGGNGGAGVSSNITGTAVTRGGGGGGSFFSTGGTIGTGGAGGGGDGASTGVDAAGVGVAGAANTGGGGGGSHSNGNSSTSASGGSGVVIIRVRARA